MAKLQNEIIITPFLYNSSSLEELLTKYSNALRNSNNLNNTLHANKIDEIQNILLDNKFLAMIRKHYDSLYSCTKKAYPNLKFYLDGRRKSVIGSEKKINLYLLQGRDLADFKDELAFRFIVFDNNIETCYSLMKTVIEFNISKGFIPCKATPVFQTEGFEKQNFPDVTIPEKSFLPSNRPLTPLSYALRLSQ